MGKAGGDSNFGQIDFRDLESGSIFLRREQNGKKDKDDFRCDVCDVRRRLLEYNKRCRRERPWPLRQAQGRLARKISGMPLAAEA